MKALLFALASLWLATSVTAQDTETSIKSFDKIIASPRVNVVLTQGTKESIRILYNSVPPEHVNVVVKHGKLKVYLDRARITEKQVRNSAGSRHGIYEGSSITAYVTYTHLVSIEMRGEEELFCEGSIQTDKFKLKAYGETEIRLATLETKKFKTSLYGRNRLMIQDGQTDRQVYRLFGENRIDTRGLKSTKASGRIYGVGKLSLAASDQVRISAFGEPTIRISGTSLISKGIILGRADIRSER